MEDVVLEVNGIDVEYRTEAGTLNAVRDVSFRIHRRESLGLVGESGSGKSTLAMGAIPHLGEQRTDRRWRHQAQRY